MPQMAEYRKTVNDMGLLYVFYSGEIIAPI